ncbi:MAG: hypothetical protein ACI4EH_06630 [Oliverpabstia sp.]
MIFCLFMIIATGCGAVTKATVAVDHQNKRIFAGECKYHAKPVDVPVYFALKKG